MHDPEGGDNAGAASASDGAGDAQQTGFLPSKPARHEAESVFVRLIATAGIIGIGTVLGAVLTAENVSGWIIGVAVSLLSVVLAAVLWRSRTL